jgi:hypothetical protein
MELPSPSIPRKEAPESCVLRASKEALVDHAPLLLTKVAPQPQQKFSFFSLHA